MTRKDMQLDQLRRHSIRNYIVKDNRVHPCNWADRVTANEKKEMKKLCTLFISEVQMYKPKATLHHFFVPVNVVLY